MARNSACIGNIINQRRSLDLKNSEILIKNFFAINFGAFKNFRSVWVELKSKTSFTMKIFVVLSVLLFVFSCDEANAYKFKVEGNKCSIRSITLQENEVLSNISPDAGITEVFVDRSTLYEVPAKIFYLYSNVKDLALWTIRIQKINRTHSRRPRI